MLADRPELILVNARVFTMDPARPVASAVAIAGDRIVGIGTPDDFTARPGSGVSVVNLRGRVVLPGFIDSHCHLAKYGLVQLGLDCKARRISSIGDLQAALAATAERLPPGAWIRARGYDHKRLAERRHPTRWDLDSVVPDHPIHLVRVCGHIAVANSLALDRAGINDETPDPAGGRFERADGRLTGVMHDAAQGPILAASRPSSNELHRALEIAESDLLKVGITTAVDCGGVDGHVRAWQHRRHTGEQRLRVTLSVQVGLGRDEGRRFLESEISTGFGDDFLRIGPFKVMVDGSSSGPTAATREPYTSDPLSTGHLDVSQDELNQWLTTAYNAGFQLTMHAVGDRAIEMGLDGIGSAVGSEGDTRRPPSRIEHCAMVPADLLVRLVELQVVPVTQPYFLYEFGDGYLRDYGLERGGRMFPLHSFLSHDVPAAASSDAPVSRFEPLRGVQAAVTRLTEGGEIAGPDERIGVMDALRMYTVNGARACGVLGTRGSLEAGKLADLVVLDADPAAVSPEEIGEIPAVLTIVGGKPVHQSVGL